MDNCAECGHLLRLSSGPGRTRTYRGIQGFVIPEQLTYPECDHCGARWMTDAQLDILSDALEAQRSKWQPEAFETVWKHEPEWERGFLSHTLLVALRTVGVATNTALAQALQHLPAQLRGQAYVAPDEVKDLVLQLVEIAERDPRFLQNFMDGNRCAPMFGDDDD